MAPDLTDMRERLGRMVIGNSRRWVGATPHTLEQPSHDVIGPHVPHVHPPAASLQALSPATRFPYE